MPQIEPKKFPCKEAIDCINICNKTGTKLSIRTKVSIVIRSEDQKNHATSPWHKIGPGSLKKIST